jgi:hypothetical protein
VDVGEVRGIILSLPSIGVCKVTFTGSDGTTAGLCHENVPEWKIQKGENFFAVGKPCEDVPPAEIDAKSVVIIAVVGFVVFASSLVAVIVALRIRKQRRANAERTKQINENGLGMQSLAGTDITFYE